MRTPAFLTATLILLVVSSPFAQEAQEPQATQREDVASFLGDTADLAERIASVDAAGARDLANRVPSAWHVRRGDQEFTITTEWITGPLRQAAARPAVWAKTREALAKRVSAVRTEAADLDTVDHQEAAGSQRISATAARAALQDVLARREFQQRNETRWSVGFQRWIQHVIEDLLSRLSINRRATAAFSKGLAWVVAIGALAALLVYLYRLRLPRRTLTQLAIEVPRLSSAEWVARAYAALRAGDAREAMHCGYHAVLFRLEEQGVWRVDDARTPREYVSLLPAHDARRPAFVDLTRRFEQTWYGSRAADGQGLLNHLEAFGCTAPSKPATSPS